MNMFNSSMFNGALSKTASLVVNAVSSMAYKIVMFGSSRAALGTVGYQIYDATNVAVGTRVTAGIQNLGGGAVTVADNFNGRITWDSGEGTPVYASDELNSNVRVDMTQAVPVRDLTSVTTQNLGDCLSAARADGVGGMAIIGNYLVYYGPNNEIVRTLLLNDPVNPTARS
jgi:hypothetical protein